MLPCGCPSTCDSARKCHKTVHCMVHTQHPACRAFTGVTHNWGSAAARSFKLLIVVCSQGAGRKQHLFITCFQNNSRLGVCWNENLVLDNEGAFLRVSQLLYLTGIIIQGAFMVIHYTQQRLYFCVLALSRSSEIL